MRNFLLGVVLGLALGAATYQAIDAWSRMNQRVSFIEGYIAQLDAMMRAAR